MDSIVAIALLLGFCALLVLGLLSVLQDLMLQSGQDEPTFAEREPAAQETRSQFSWHARSHFDAPD